MLFVTCELPLSHLSNLLPVRLALFLSENVVPDNVIAVPAVYVVLVSVELMVIVEPD